VDVDVVAVDALYLSPIFIVCCKFITSQLTSHNCSFSLRYGNRGMEVKLGHHRISNSERRGNEGGSNR
jgi:hypothetical protein